MQSLSEQAGKPTPHGAMPTQASDNKQQLQGGAQSIVCGCEEASELVSSASAQQACHTAVPLLAPEEKRRRRLTVRLATVSCRPACLSAAHMSASAVSPPKGFRL